jgi:hypothetical protein
MNMAEPDNLPANNTCDVPVKVFIPGRVLDVLLMLKSNGRILPVVVSN